MKNTSCPIFLLCLLALVTTSCSTYTSRNVGSGNMMLADNKPVVSAPKKTVNYASRLPQHLNTNGQKVILVDPNVHAFGAYNSNGELIKAGLAVAGANWCADRGRPCKTKAGSFRIQSLGAASCKSTIYPLPRGGAPMPYCMFFNGNQGLHGTYPGGLAEANLSHGCVRVSVADAEWIRFNFANIGTKVIVKSY
jgi:lipoprotein-anchoring transpeptidase ErfK/SrfK